MDRILQSIRIKKAGSYISQGDAVLDIGCANGELFKCIEGISFGVGVDPDLQNDIERDNYILLKGFFPERRLPGETKFNVITMLAVLEHIPEKLQKALAIACFDSLDRDGKIVITVPSHRVDIILAILKKLRLIDGMNLEQHFGFRIADTKQLFSSPYFRLIHHKKFQFGLNNLFVFQKGDKEGMK